MGHSEREIRLSLPEGEFYGLLGSVRWLREGAHLLLNESPTRRAIDKLLAAMEAERGEKITHGRHCTCWSCAAEDWSRPELAPCGMHGEGCLGVYQPWGPAGTYVRNPPEVQT